MWNFKDDLAARTQLVANISTLLATGQYYELERLSEGNRLSRSDMQIAVTSYGRRLLPLPHEVLEDIDYVACVGAQPARWSVVVPLFTAEEGRSDLSLELTLIGQGEYRYAVEIDNIHVR